MRSGNDNNFENNNKNINSKKRPKSTEKQKILMFIWIVVTLFICYQIFMLAGYTLGKIDKDKVWLYNAIDNVVQKIIPKKPSQTQEEKNLKVAALGDIYSTPNILKGAKSTTGEYDFSRGLEDVEKILNEYDLVLASLKTPIAKKSLGYSTVTAYNTPEEILTTLKKLNISILATATTHAMDKGENGVTQTIENLKNSEIKQVGIYNQTRENPEIVSKNDINIGVLSYTYIKSNSKIKTTNVNELNDKNLEEDIQYLKEKNVDFIVTYLNVSDYDSTLIESEQKECFEILFNSGVNVVLGSGVMAVQQDIEDEIELEENKKSHIYGIYSLGDFMGGYSTTEAKASAIANIEFTKTFTKNRKGEIINIQTDMKIKEPILLWTVIDKNYDKQVFVMKDVIDKYNSDNSSITLKEYQSMKEEYERIIEMLK